MRNIIVRVGIILGILLIPAVTFAAGDVNITPTSYSVYTDLPSGTISWDDSLSADNYAIIMFAPDGTPPGKITAVTSPDLSSSPLTNVICDYNLDMSCTSVFQIAQTGIYRLVFITNYDINGAATIANACDIDYASCLSAGATVGSSVTFTYGDVPPTNGPLMDSVITNASSTFTTAVGFNWSDVVTFMKSLLLLVIGSGLGLLQVLLPYIIALVTIGAIVYFLYRAFRFFRH